MLKEEGKVEGGATKGDRTVQLRAPVLKEGEEIGGKIAVNDESHVIN